jgi:hypothetical protein
MGWWTVEKLAIAGAPEGFFAETRLGTMWVARQNGYQALYTVGGTVTDLSNFQCVALLNLLATKPVAPEPNHAEAL